MTTPDMAAIAAAAARRPKNGQPPQGARIIKVSEIAEFFRTCAPGEMAHIRADNVKRLSAAHLIGAGGTMAPDSRMNTQGASASKPEYTHP